MQFRSILDADLDRVLDWTVTEPVAWISADRYREESAAGQFRPEWTWIAQEDGRVLARALWWGRSDSVHPLALDCLSVHESVADPASLAAELLAAGHRAFTELGATELPKYTVMLPSGGPDVSDDAAAKALAAAVGWRAEAAGRAGLSERLERLRFEWTPQAGTREPSGRLVFTPEPDDEAMVAVFRRIAEGSLDAETLANVASMGVEEAARDDLAFYLDCPGERDWWRLVHTPDGRLAGLAIPSRTPYGPNVGYLGVVPELRGQGFIDDILAEITRFHATAGAERITATTDSTNFPMAAAFRRAGYHLTETRVVLSAPGH
ncbi:GNAT family N-acetyltransferase [Kitasatospora mediocidica]|uniref:GNAT family N-acetyltransferase n=1 Tax=Kitasatospora mediocidica TaxID=58352 RepID=UPI000569EA88|nr:GNAT family N-acetyltransferase [Kitasatospora mediocidica]